MKTKVSARVTLSPSVPRRAVLAGLCAAFPATSRAQSGFPSRPVRMVVNFPPGGVVDRTARLVASYLPQQLGQPVVVENRSGGSGTVGAQAVVQAAPDGHTLLVSFSSLTINPALQPGLPFDTLQDLLPVTRLVDTPQILVAHPSLNVRTVQDLIAHARSRRQPLRYASVGIGTPGHLAGEVFAQMAGIPLEHVPYRGTGLAAPDVIAGRVPLYFVSFPSGYSLVQSGGLVAIGVASEARLSSVPDVPTIAEGGLSGYAVAAWVGAFLPARTPEPLRQRWNGAIQAVLAVPEVRTSLLEAGAEPAHVTPDAFANQVAEELPFWQRFVAERGITAD